MSLLIVRELPWQPSLSIQGKTLCIRWRTSWNAYMYVSPLQRFILSHKYIIGNLLLLHYSSIHLVWIVRVLSTKVIRSSISCNLTRCSAIAERPHCRVHQFQPKVEDWNWETIFYRHFRSVFNHCNKSACKAIEFGEKNAK